MINCGSENEDLFLFYGTEVFRLALGGVFSW